MIQIRIKKEKEIKMQKMLHKIAMSGKKEIEKIQILLIMNNNRKERNKKRMLEFLKII